MNKKSIVLVWMISITCCLNAQDFVSLFMENNKDDSALSRITISPGMMEEILKSESDKNDNVLDIISKLKSMQVLTSSDNGEAYYNKALETFEISSGRYEPMGSFNSGNEDYKIFVRKRKDSIIEMAMMMFRNNKFAVISITGEIEPEFISTLARSVSRNKF